MSTENFRKSCRIFNHLIRYKELSSESSKRFKVNGEDLYEEYKNIPEVRNFLDIQAEEFNTSILWVGNTIYLLPNEDNNFLGYTKTELKNALCQNGTENEFRLALFSIGVLMLLFYNGTGTESKVRNSIKIGDYQNAISSWLKEGERKNPKDDYYSSMLQVYENFSSADLNTARKNKTKEGFIKKIISFLEKQNLLSFIDGRIFTKNRFDHIMTWNRMNIETLDRFTQLFSQNEDASNE